MFGYIKPDVPNMRIKEYDKYKAFYCGLCKTMSKCTGKCSGCTLSYDFVFLAVLRTVLTSDSVEIQKSRCGIKFFKKQNVVMPTESLKYCAYAAALLTEYKLKDDIRDEKGTKKLKAMTASLILRSSYRRAKKEYPDLDELIRLSVDALSEREKAQDLSIDICADLSGELLKNVFSFGLEGEAHAIASAIGKSFGRWIYIVDAADDYYDDIKFGRFNPLCSGNAGHADSQKIADNVKVTLGNILADAEPAFDLIDYGENEHSQDLKAIIENIIYAGLIFESRLVVNKMCDSGKSYESKGKGIG